MGKTSSSGWQKGPHNSQSPWLHFASGSLREWFNVLLLSFFPHCSWVFVLSLRLWIPKTNLMGLSLIPVYCCTTQQTPCLSAGLRWWCVLWLMLERLFYISQGQTPCILKSNLKSCWNQLQNYSCVPNTRGFERISNKYGKIEKLALGIYGVVERQKCRKGCPWRLFI